jgi:hypothetical protein
MARFQKGNPGRMPGSKNKKTIALERVYQRCNEVGFHPADPIIEIAKSSLTPEDLRLKACDTLLSYIEGKQKDGQPFTPERPEMTPEEEAAFEEKMKKIEELGEIMFCHGCKSIHHISWSDINGVNSSGRILGGPDCSLKIGEIRQASIDPLTGYAYDPDYQPERKYDTRTGKQINTTDDQKTDNNAHPFLDAALEEAVRRHRERRD